MQDINQGRLEVREYVNHVTCLEFLLLISWVIHVCWGFRLLSRQSVRDMTCVAAVEACLVSLVGSSDWSEKVSRFLAAVSGLP